MQAFASFAAAVSVQPAHVGALTACAAVYRRCGQLPSAIATLEKARKAAPEDQAVQQAYAKALNAQGKHVMVLKGQVLYQDQSLYSFCDVQQA